MKSLYIFCMTAKCNELIFPILSLWLATQKMKLANMQFLKHKCDFCYVGTFIALQAGQFNAWIGSQISKAVKIVAPFYQEMECRWNICFYFLSKIILCVKNALLKSLFSVFSSFINNFVAWLKPLQIIR